MFTSTSIKIVNSLGCRRISHLISKNYVRKYSSQYVSKTCQSQSSYRHSVVLRNVQKNRIFPSCSYQTKSKDFNKEDDENFEMENKGKNVLDDLEFQSILKDFSRDFGVNDESKRFLEEIKQHHRDSLDDDTEKSPGKASSSSNKLDFRNETDVRTTKCCPLSDSYLQEPHGYYSPSVQHFEETVDGGENFFHVDQELEEREEYDVKRGKNGVYDIGELVTVLKKENLTDICVIEVPVTFHYADYLVLATAKSPRHCNAIVEFIIKLYKKKKNKEDPFIKCEGETTATWKALDMGNIVLHIFLEDTRIFYDIESFWLLDKEYDNIDSIKSDPHLDVMQQHLDFLNKLGPTVV